MRVKHDSRGGLFNVAGIDADITFVGNTNNSCDKTKIGTKQQSSAYTHYGYRHNLSFFIRHMEATEWGFLDNEGSSNRAEMGPLEGEV